MQQRLLCLFLAPMYSIPSFCVWGQDPSRIGILIVKLGRLENFFIASSYTGRQEKISGQILVFQSQLKKVDSSFYNQSWGRTIPVFVSCFQCKTGQQGSRQSETS